MASSQTHRQAGKEKGMITFEQVQKLVPEEVDGSAKTGEGREDEETL